MKIDAERQRLINQAARILGEINQLFMDAEHWNTHTRVRLYPDAEPIDVDPNGEMARLKQGLESQLLHEAKLGYFPIPADHQHVGEE